MALLCIVKTEALATAAFAFRRGEIPRGGGGNVSGVGDRKGSGGLCGGVAVLAALPAVEEGSTECLRPAQAVVQVLQAVNIAVEGLARRSDLAGDAVEQLGREASLQGVSAGLVAVFQDRCESGKVGVVTREVVIALPKVFKLPGGGGLLVGIAEDPGQFAEKGASIVKLDVPEDSKELAHSGVCLPAQELEAVTQTVLFVYEPITAGKNQPQLVAKATQVGSVTGERFGLGDL